MNIFALSYDPILAAHYHCDQHLHKMILESAQMLSTACHSRSFIIPPQDIYKPAYQKHPCTLWAASTIYNMAWLCELTLELENIRQAQSNCAEHSSTAIVRLIKSYLEKHYPAHYHPRYSTPFALTMPAHIALDNSRYLNAIQKYQAYYRFKHKKWVLDKGKYMTYKGRAVPPFMHDLISEGK